MKKVSLVLAIFIIPVQSHFCDSNEKVTICQNVILKENVPLEIENYTKILKINPPLDEIPPRVFMKLPNVETLIINFTLMEKIYSHSFDGLNNLRELDLYWNEIPNIPPHAFSNCPNLIYLNIGGNELHHFNGDTLAHLKHLQKLIISSNSLSSVPKLENLTSLELLDLSKNKIKRLYNNSFKGLNNLINLNLRGNQMYFIQNNAFNGLNKLKYLNIERNELDIIDLNDFYYNLPELKEIRLNINSFSCRYLKEIIRNFTQSGIIVPEGLAEVGPISYHGIFCRYP